MSEQKVQSTMTCPKCKQQVVPIVTSVGGGSCSVGRRDRFYCPLCQHTIARKGCFIAAATYEGADADEVLVLREYRDAVLADSKIGRAFTKFYYRSSPYIAQIVDRSVHLKKVARKVLDKLVLIAERQLRDK